jgi:Fic family protein
MIQRAFAAIVSLCRSPKLLIDRITDTRRLHGAYFRGLAPRRHAYFVGHYRGEAYLCLRYYEVEVGGHRGHPAGFVEKEMEAFAWEIRSTIRDLDFLQTVRDVHFSKRDKLFRTVQIAAALFYKFLYIHPYADGNGHVARLFLVAVLARYGIQLSRFPVHPRPDKGYDEFVRQYALGNRAPLENYIIDCI